MKLKALILLFICTCTLAFGQDDDDHSREKIKALKVAYITEHLNLTSAEAEKFWPVYNKHEDKIYRLYFVEMKDIKRQLKDKSVEDISEQEAQKLLDKFIKLENELFDEKKNMNVDLKKVLSAKKIILLKKIEDDFNRELLRQLRRDHKPH